MSLFFRFPHTPHISWLGTGLPRDDKVLSDNEVTKLLAGEVVIEEKLDGANLGLSLGPDSEIQVQNRGQYLLKPYSGQFSRLGQWLEQQGDGLPNVLSDDLIIFGEWCAAQHSINYENLPDWFLIFDVYDKSRKQFWSARRRNALVAEMGLFSVPELKRAKLTLSDLKDILASQPSRFQDGPIEGIVVRRDSADWNEGRAKLVRADFTQAIGDHWTKRNIVWNRLQFNSLNKNKF